MSNIAKDIEDFEPKQGSWMALDSLVGNLNGLTPEVISACLGIFEKYPEEDGEGVFFTIIHTLEHFGGYEEALAASVLKKPNQWNVLMLNRMLNVGIDASSKYTIHELLTHVQCNSLASVELRETAKEYLG